MNGTLTSAICDDIQLSFFVSRVSCAQNYVCCVDANGYFLSFCQCKLFDKVCFPVPKQCADHRVALDRLNIGIHNGSRTESIWTIRATNVVPASLTITTASLIERQNERQVYACRQFHRISGRGYLLREGVSSR